MCAWAHMHTATHTTPSFLNSSSFEHYAELVCCVCEDKGQPHIMLAPGAVCLCDSVHTIRAKNGVCVHVCFVLFIHMDEGVFERGGSLGSLFRLNK